MKISFNKAYLTGKESEYIQQVLDSGNIAGNGHFTALCHSFFENRFGFRKTLLTNSNSDALEMAAILLDIKPDDEVIMPSFTDVSTANPFALRGATIKFADIDLMTLNISSHEIQKLISTRTKAIVVKHFAGIACDMDPILQIAREANVFVIEDASYAVNSEYKGKALGGVGDLAVFSFHASQNISSGEGGLLIINNKELQERAEIIWQQGAVKVELPNEQSKKYSWADLGSSFIPSEIVAAFLHAQIENIDKIQQKRKDLWNKYKVKLSELELKDFIKLPFIPDYANHNYNTFYILTHIQKLREKLILFLEDNGILCDTQYVPLHLSEYYTSRYERRILKNTEDISGRVINLPLYYSLQDSEIDYICDKIHEFFFKT